jgi:hypothetical protein
LYINYIIYLYNKEIKMAAHFIWYESNGAGETMTSGVSNVNWKNIDDTTTAYTASPVTAGNNSFDKWQFGRFQGPYNQLLNGKFAHTAGTLGTGLTLKGQPSMTVDADRLAYATPSTTTNASLSVDMTSAISIGSGSVVFFGATGASNSGKAASTTSNPAFTNYLTTQMQTTGSALPGDTATVTLTLQYDEN